MNENEARYIIRMIETFKSNVLFLDATDKDSDLHDKMKQWYDDGGGGQSGSEYAQLKMILHVQENGVSSGEYFEEVAEDMELHLKLRGIPKIERRKSAR